MTAWVDLYWLPLGAGGRSVRLNGRVYELLVAIAQRRTPQDLYHSALEVRLGEDRYVIEMAPAWDAGGARRGVVAQGAVGARPLGVSRWFRYEIRRWLDGRIPDVAEAVDSPRRLSDDPVVAGRVLEALARVPTPVWGSRVAAADDMWNSNSVVAWTLATAGIDPAGVQPPPGGRAPGWAAGVSVAGCSSGEGGIRTLGGP